MPNGYQERVYQQQGGWEWSRTPEEYARLDLATAVDAALARGEIQPWQADSIMAGEMTLAQAVAGPAAPVGYPPVVTPAGAVVPAAGLAPPTIAPRPGAPRAPRGRTMTMIVSQAPGLPPEVRSVTPGGVALFARDVTAAKRVKRVGQKVQKLFPRRMGKRRVFKAAGKAIA